MNIRKAELNDLQQIITLNKIVDYEQPDYFIIESIDLWRVFVIENSWGIAWFLLYQNIWGNTILMSLLKIHSNFYRQWLWSQLLDYFEEFLRTQWIHWYVSSAMLDNHWAQIFHEKKNFQDIGILNMGYGKEKFYKKDL